MTIPLPWQTTQRHVECFEWKYCRCCCPRGLQFRCILGFVSAWRHVYSLFSWSSRLWLTWQKWRRGQPLCHNQVLMNLYNGRSHPVLIVMSTQCKLNPHTMSDGPNGSSLLRWRANSWCLLLSKWQKVCRITLSFCSRVIYLCAVQ